MADGIGRLIAVTQMKSNNANDEAMLGSDKQRDLLLQQKGVRDQLRAFDDKVRDKKVTQDEYWQISQMLGVADVGQENWTGGWDGLLGNHDASVGQWSATLGAEGQQKTNQDLVDGARKRLDDKKTDLEGQDKLGNFEIQDLMSQYNQAEQLASNVLKKRDDTGNAVIGKV